MTQDGAIIQSFMGFIDGSNHFSIQASDTGSGDINLFLNPDGFVGVKTQSPSATLTVRGPDDPDAGPVVRLDSSLGNNAFESGRVRLCEGTVSYLGGYMHYDGAANRLHIGVHNTSDTIPGNDLNSISINRANGRVGIGTANPAQLLDVAGTARVDVLEIEGGADLSERFDVATNGDAIELGMVVCIDPTNPGKLVLSRGAYDPAVAGVISGAGGVSTGMLMGHDGTVADGEHAVALTGRVYVWCDASTGAIKPGDMLTTSDVAGHAMRATDRHRAFGSVIGKAMTGLDDGRGLVLVLVGLQ